MNARPLLACIVFAALAACEGNTRFDLRLRARAPAPQVGPGATAQATPVGATPEARRSGS